MSFVQGQAKQQWSLYAPLISLCCLCSVCIPQLILHNNSISFFTFRFFQKKIKIWGGGKKFQNIFLIHFLAKSSNSKDFSFFSLVFFKKKINCGHYVCLPSTKIVVTMFACHLHNSSGMCLHLPRTNHVSAESPSKSPLTPKKKPKKTRGGGVKKIFTQIFIIFFRSPRKNLEPYNNPFYEN